MKYSANSLCHCGSRKKYKRCCRAKDEGMEKLAEMFSTGQLPFRAEVISPSGESSEMIVEHASISHDGITTVLLDERVTLATNSTPGETLPNSSASISIPPDGISAGIIRVIGNSSVSNTSVAPRIILNGGAKKLKAVSETGLFVVARKGLQKETQIEYFDFLFGISGQSESLNEFCEKQRPHIALHPSGNGKFIRLSGHNCEIEGEMRYCAESHQISPYRFRIKSLDFGETIEVTFSTDANDQVVLDGLIFVSNEHI